MKKRIINHYQCWVGHIWFNRLKYSVFQEDSNSVIKWMLLAVYKNAQGEWTSGKRFISCNVKNTEFLQNITPCLNRVKKRIINHYHCGMGHVWFNRSNYSLFQAGRSIMADWSISKPFMKVYMKNGHQVRDLYLVMSKIQTFDR